MSSSICESKKSKCALNLINPEFTAVTLYFQMKVCMDEFRSLAARYADLHQSSFDADYATLRNVELYPLNVPRWHHTRRHFDNHGFLCCNVFLFNCLLRQQQSCLLVSHVIEALILDPQAARWELLLSCRKGVTMWFLSICFHWLDIFEKADYVVEKHWGKCQLSVFACCERLQHV